MAEATSPTATVEAFVEELLKDPMKDWYTMGFLLGLYEYPLKEIAWKHRPNGIDACLKEIYDTLEAEGVKLTWEQIIDALSTAAMDNKKLAEEINQKYCGGKYTTTHGTDEEHENDKKLAKFLLEICRGDQELGLTHDDADGFFFIQQISRRVNRRDITPENVRRAVAITPQLRLNRGPLPTSMKIRADTNHQDTDKPIVNLGGIYHFMSTICRFGDKKLTAAEDGSFAVKEIVDLKLSRAIGNLRRTYRDMYTEENIRKAIMYNNKDELILIESARGLRIKHIAIHPKPWNKEDSHPDKRLWSDVRSCCCKVHRYDELHEHYDKVEGYVAVSDIVKTLSKQRHNRYLREEDVIRVVKNCPPTCQPDWLILDENSPIRVKATWGHVMPVERPQIQPTLTTADKIPPFVIAMISRKIWVKQKHGIVPYARYRIELEYLDKAPSTDDEILKHYGHHQVIVVIDLEKAIKDGRKFHLQPPRIIVCSEEQIPIKYMKRIL